MRTDFSYRPDIDGLRAIAVGIVILFHSRLGVVPGGYVGVDVFFVISGYLITAIIWRELASGSFSFANFYERRIRRIFPALTVILLATTVAGALLLAPQDYTTFARSAKATAAFYCNFFFYQQSGYFMPAAETQPLLHTWSLAVEEQFYLVAPWFLILLARVPRHYRTALFLLLFASSLGVSAFGAAREDTGAFYLPHSRAFELMMGMALALGLVPALRRDIYREAVGIAGIALIALAALLYSERTAFPGFAALVPCLGAAFIIHSATVGPTMVSRMLSNRGVVLIGKISYSLYLWHWPLFVFADLEYGAQLTALHRVGLIGLAVALSFVTYWFVEQPARRRTPLITRTTAIACGVSAMVFFVVSSQLIVLTRGWPERLPREISAFAAAVAASRISPPCPEIEERIGVAQRCEIGAKDAKASTFVLWGDSHARMIASQVSKIAESKGLKGLVVIQGGCSPFSVADVGGGLFDIPKCAGLFDRVERLLKDDNVPHVIIAARWAFYAEGGGYHNGTYATNRFDTGDRRKNHEQFLGALHATIERLTATGRTVTLIGPVPELKMHLPNAMMKAMMRHEPIDFPVSYATFEKRQSAVLSALERMNALPGVRVVYPHKFLCNGVVCATSRDGMSLYTDDDHLGSFGTETIAAALASAVDFSLPFDEARQR